MTDFNLGNPANRILTSLVLLNLACASAFADSARNSPASDELSEIVITAERHDSTVLKTPLSITAVSGEQLQAEGISRLQDLSFQTPGIAVKPFSPGDTEFEMRGLPSTGGSSATIGLYLNDIPMAAAANSYQGKGVIDPDLYDLQRVEVLRGPQGTLYGAGSMGGTVRLITAPPVLGKFEGSSQTELSYTQHGGVNVGQSGMINLPVVGDTLAVRLVGTAQYNDGWIEQITVNPFPLGTGGNCGWAYCTRGNVAAAPVVADNQKTNSERLDGGRAAVLFKPTDELTINGMFMYQGLHLGNLFQVDNSGGVGVDQLQHYTLFNYLSPLEDTFRVGSLNIDYDFGFARLTSATATWNHTTWWQAENSEPATNVLTTFFSDPQKLLIQTYNQDTVKQTSEELRLASEGNGRLQWVVGAFYSTFVSTPSFYNGNPGQAQDSVGGAAANPQGTAFSANNPYHVKQYAAFAEASYYFAPFLKGTAGVRGYKYESRLDSEISGIFGPSGNATPTFSSASKDASGVSPKFNLSYEPNASLTVYTEIAKGFRPGGINYPPPANLCPGTKNTYDSDYIWNYEIGEKARLFDGRLSINADVYYIRWSNTQQLLALPCTYVFSTNAGSAESYGPELEINAKITPRLTFSFSGAYNNSHLTSIDAAYAGSTIGSTEVLKPGTPSLNVPQYNFAEALEYRMPVADGLNASLRVSATTTGPLYDLNYYVEHLPPFTIGDIRLGLAANRWDAYLFVHNFTNRIAELTVSTLEYFGPTPSTEYPSVTTPRTTGMQFNYRF